MKLQQLSFYPPPNCSCTEQETSVVNRSRATETLSRPVAEDRNAYRAETFFRKKRFAR